MKSSGSVKKVFSVLLTVMSWIVVAFAVGIMIFTIVSVNTLDKNDRPIFGYKFYIVRSDSMSLSENNKDEKIHFNSGDVIITKDIAYKEACSLEIGQVISFISQNEENFGETVTHKIGDVRYNTAGKLLGYMTYGTNTGDEDDVLVEPDFVLGVYAGKIPKLGHFFAFLKTTPGYIIFILIPFLLLIGYNGINCIRLFLKYRKEQMEEMQAERDKIEEERQRAAEMMKEIEELKARLAAEKSGDSEKPEESDKKDE